MLLWQDARRVEIQAVRSDPNVEAALVRYSAALCHAKVFINFIEFMITDIVRNSLVASSMTPSSSSCACN
jgi:hypothetical protein